MSECQEEEKLGSSDNGKLSQDSQAEEEYEIVASLSDHSQEPPADEI